MYMYTHVDCGVLLMHISLYIDDDNNKIEKMEHVYNSKSVCC